MSDARPPVSVVVPLLFVQKVVTVNGGKWDDTLTLLFREGNDFPEPRVGELLRNFGHMAALIADIKAARLFMDLAFPDGPLPRC